MAKSIPLKSNSPLRRPTHEEIAHAALHLSLHRGVSQGYQPQDWHRARQLLCDGFKRVAEDGGAGDADPESKPMVEVKDCGSILPDWI